MNGTAKAVVRGTIALLVVSTYCAIAAGYVPGEVKGLEGIVGAVVGFYFGEEVGARRIGPPL